jgi:hypothetical protein
MNWTVEETRLPRGSVVEWAEPGKFILSRNDQLFVCGDPHSAWRSIAKAPASQIRSLTARFRPFQRLLRFMFYNVIPLADGSIFFTFDKSVGIVRNGSATVLAGLERPARVLRSGCAVDPSGDVYFGEYIANDRREALNIYRFSPGSDHVETAAALPPGFARHIHGIYFDEFDKRLVALTGDLPHESRFVISSDGFSSYEVLYEGDESYRAVSILFDKDAIYYGTDAEHRANVIYRIDRSTGRRTALGEVNGTVFYSKRFAGHFIFATTAENAPSQQRNAAELWATDGSGPPKCLASFPKDAWPGGLFMFGTIHFPFLNDLEDRLYFSLVGVRGDGKTYVLRPGRQN